MVRAVVLVVAVAMATAGGACSSKVTPENGPAVTNDPPQPVAPDPRPRVFVGDHAVAVEVVATPPRIEKGLMYRQHLAPDDGMLFVMPEEADHHFWMKNTLIPLDILFITRELTVAGILHDMRPRDLTSKGVGRPSRYVLEVNAGWTAAHGIEAGAVVRFDGVPVQ